MNIPDILVSRANNLLCHLLVVNQLVLLSIASTYNLVSNVFQSPNPLAYEHMFEDVDFLVFDVNHVKTIVCSNSI